jgi:hypothetical protein
VKNNLGTSLNGDVFFLLLPVEYLIKKLPIPMKQGTVILIKVRSYNAPLHSQLVCTSTHLKSVLRYIFLIFYTYRMDILIIL